MTNPMLAELDEVVAGVLAANSFDRVLTANRKAADFLRTHHAEIADMAKRMEAAERDSRRLDWLEGQREAYGFEDCHEGNRWVIDGPFATARAAIDATQEGGAG